MPINSMADWSSLPADLVAEISQLLHATIDTIRFRSICSNWRSLTPKPRFLPTNNFLIPCSLPYNYATCTKPHLSKHKIFLITSPRNCSENEYRSWIIKIKEGVLPERLKLFNPLLNTEIGDLKSPKVLNFFHCRVTELAHECIVQYETLGSEDDFDYNIPNRIRAAFLSSGTIKENEYCVALVDQDDYWKLLLYKSKDNSWTRIEDSIRYCKAVISFKDMFYAVNEKGQAMRLDSYGNVYSLSDVGYESKKRFLVESDGKLLLVDMLTESIGNENTVQFRIFKFIEETCTWNQMQSLGDCLLFLGEYCSFSISMVSKLCGIKGNCIIFANKLYTSDDTSYRIGVRDRHGPYIIKPPELTTDDLFLFNFNSFTVQQLSNYPGYYNLLCKSPLEMVL